MSTSLLQLTDISKSFSLGTGWFGAKQTLQAVKSVSLSLEKQQTLAIVGESGCGKTTLGKMVTLLSPPTSGSIRLGGQEITDHSKHSLKAFRRLVQMIFQDPYASLNPRLKISSIISEPLKVQGTKPDREDMVALLNSVGLKGDDLALYPHQFSGGQRQRVAIARALSLKPALLVADEPTSALDVSIQSQILGLMKELQDQHHLSYFLISHDLAVVARMADEIAVMYFGEIVEKGPKSEVLTSPKHPYTQALLEASPKIGNGKRRPRFNVAGEPPNLLDPPKGCAYASRCNKSMADCKKINPVLLATSPGHEVACLLFGKADA